MTDLQTGVCTGEVQPMQRGQAEELMPMIVRVTEKAGISFSDIGLIATTVGPGAFTGLRLGLSAARALGLALDRPVAGLTTFEVLAARWRMDHPGGEAVLAVILETKRQDFYYQLMDAEGGELTPPAAGTAEETAAAIRRAADAKPAVLIGDALDRFADVVTPDTDWTLQAGYELTDSATMARLAALQNPRRAAEPLYLRGADVSQPKRKPREIIG